MDRYTRPGLAMQLCILHAVIVHSGSTIEAGHYITRSYIKKHNRWRSFNDVKVKTVHNLSTIVHLAINDFVYLMLC